MTSLRLTLVLIGLAVFAISINAEPRKKQYSLEYYDDQSDETSFEMDPGFAGPTQDRNPRRIRPTDTINYDELRPMDIRKRQKKSGK